MSRRWWFALGALLLWGCEEPVEQPSPVAAATSAEPDRSDAVEPPRRDGIPMRPTRNREGNAIALNVAGDALYVADEDHARLRVVPLPVGDAPAREIDLGGRPAAVVALADRVLVTLRDPGALVILKENAKAELVEEARVAVADDAWGVAVTPDEQLAVVTSAWTGVVSGVHLADRRVLWRTEVAREPRGVVIRQDGRAAYVTHLMGAGITRIDGLDGPPRVSRVRLPAAPLRTPEERSDAAALGYSAVLSPDGRRLFAPRRALGAEAPRAWAGVGTVDVLITAADTPLLEPVAKRLHVLDRPTGKRTQPDHTGHETFGGTGPCMQPRSSIYRSTTNTLLVACEGSDAVAELDALTVDPGFSALTRYRFGIDLAVRERTRCGAPTGLALSDDEATAYVLCRTTDAIAEVSLDHEPGRLSERARLAESMGASPKLATTRTLAFGIPKPSTDEGRILARGRRLYFNAADADMSDGVGCAACHPDGRDDGHVWHDLGRKGTDFEHRSTFFGKGATDIPEDELGAARFGQGFVAFPIRSLLAVANIRGRPRQTPMLAGRVSFSGPYGWRGMQKSLEARVLEGFEKHRWFFADDLGGWGDSPVDAASDGVGPRATAIAMFLREGLVPPPRSGGALTAQQQRGRLLFTDEKTACASCHTPSRGFTNLLPITLGDGESPGGDDFNRREPQQFRTPSLLFVAGTAPYFHDGRAATLEDLIDNNEDRMGWTSHLDADERAALVAYLETL